MYARLRDIAKFLGVAAALLLSQCGGTTQSQQVKIQVLPARPIVYNSPEEILIGGVLTTINPPWFSFSVRINNQAPGTSVTITDMHVEVTGMTSTGPVTNMVDLIPGNWDYSDPFTGANCIFTDFGQFDYGGLPLPGTKVNDDELFLYGNCAPSYVTFYVSGSTNPAPTNPNSIVYEVKIEPEGFFGVRTNPQGRFYNFAITTTQ